MICGIVTDKIKGCLLEANNRKKFKPALWVHLMCIMTMMRMVVVVVMMCINCICYTVSNEVGRYSCTVNWI
jgi:hypothetical protein